MTTALQARLSPAMTVNDLKASLRFYEGLGFTMDEQWEDEGVLKGAMLRGGDARFGLSQDDFAKGRDRVKGVGIRLYFETDQDIAELARKAKEAGIKLDEGPGALPWGATGFTVTDPDGFRLTISNPE